MDELVEIGVGELLLPEAASAASFDGPTATASWSVDAG
jgi:hypothetical protein